MLRCLLALFVTLIFSAPALAAGIGGQFRAHIDGLDSVLRLDAQGSEVTGSYEEGQLRLQVRGTFQGGRLTARLIEPQQGTEIAQLQGVLVGDTLDLSLAAQNRATGERQSRQAKFQREATAATAPQSGAIDPRLVGTWVNENVINSDGSNAASFATTRTLSLSADGTAEQWTQSAGGGGDWSHGDGGPRLEFRARWYARDGVVYAQLDGQNGFQPITRYRFADPYLITENDGGRLNWRRR